MDSDIFNEDAKIYLSNALLIYSAIKDMDIKSNKLNLKDYKEDDKKALSLFLAAFVTDINLSQIIEEFEIDERQLFSLFNIDLDNLIDTYDDIKFESFKDDFSNFLAEYTFLITKKYNINIITPEVLFSELINAKQNGIIYDLIVDNYPKIYSESDGSIKLFEKVKKYALDNKLITEKSNIPSSPFQTMLEYLLGVEPGADVSFEFYPVGGMVPQEVYNDSKIEEKIDYNDISVFEKLEDIKKKFIGQEEACEYLFYNIINNQQLALRDDVYDGERSIIFLDGPTGTGKTAITREITEVLDIPFTATSVTNYSSTGYVGGNITDVLEKLLEKSQGDLEKAQRGIIVFDEFDKIAYSRESGGLSMKKAVQQQLLDFMGGGKYDLTVGNGYVQQMVEFDTSKLTFVCLGALTDLRDEKTNKKQPIGYCGSNNKNYKTYNITPQDLVDIGLEKELVGRLNTYLHTEEYSKDVLLKILLESEISPLKGFERWINSKNKELIIDPEVYYLIVDAAYDLNTGARALQTVVNSIRTVYLKEVLTGDAKIVYLDKEKVLKVIDNSTLRRVRK